MKRLNYIHLAAFVVVATYFIAACSNDAPTPEVLPSPSSSVAGEKSLIHTPTPLIGEQYAAADVTPSEQSDCSVGLVLRLHESCTYPGTSDEFWIDASGFGHFLFLTASASINAQNANINNHPYDFAARKQNDGTWIIEVASVPSDSVKVSDIIVAVQNAPTPVDTPSEAKSQITLATPEPAVILATPAPTQAPLVLMRPKPPINASVVTPIATPEATHSSPTSVPTVVPTAMQAIVPSPTPTVRSTIAARSPIVSTSVSTPLSVMAIPGMNNPPRVAIGVGDQIVPVRETLVMDVSSAFTDPDGEKVERYSVILSNTTVAHGRVNSVTGELELTGQKVGSSWVTLRACDALTCTRLGDLIFTLTVAPPPNRPPQAVRIIGERSVSVGETISVAVSPAFWDLEDDHIVSYDFSLDDPALATGTVDVSRGSILFQGTQVGTTSVSVSACDSEGCSGNDLGLQFALTVLPPPNRPPEVIGDIPDQAIHKGETIALDISSLFSDPDGDLIQDYGFLQTDRSVAVGAIESRTGRMTLRGAKEGTTLVGVNASDGRLASMGTNVTFRVTVTEPPRNPPQVVSAISDQTVDLDDSLDVFVADAFNSPSPYRIIRYDFLLRDPEVGAESEISRDGILTLSGSEEGKSWVSVRACSYLGCSNFADLSFVLIVTDSDKEPNRIPEVVGALLDRSVSVGQTVTMDVSKAFDDPDDEPIVDYKYKFSNPYMAIGSSITDTGILTLRGANMGTTTVSISACDDENECSDPDDMNFTLTVEAALSRNQGTAESETNPRPLAVN